MTDDDREPFAPEAIDSPDEEAGDPAAAFEALRETVEDLAGDLSREMTTIRKGVEAAFDRFEAFGEPTDYSADLGRLVQGLARGRGAAEGRRGVADPQERSRAPCPRAGAWRREPGEDGRAAVPEREP